MQNYNPLSLRTFEKLSLDNFMIKIKDKKYIKDVENFMNKFHTKYQKNTSLYNDKIIRKILSAYLIYYHKTSVLFVNDQYAEKIFTLSANFILTFDKFFGEGNIGLFKQYFIDLKSFLEFFDIWKKRDAMIMSRPMFNTYFEIDAILCSVPEDFPKRKEYEHMKTSIRQKIRLMCGEEGLRCLETRQLPIFLDEKIFTDIDKTVRKAFWDVFEANMKEKKYNGLVSIMIELRDIIFKLIPNRPDLHKSFNDNLDMTLIKQMLDILGEQDINKHFLTNIAKQYINFIKMLQAPEDDEDTKLFEENLNSKLDIHNNKQEEILRFFFETSFKKIEKIKRSLEIIKKSTV